MEWRDEGIVIGLRRQGEYSAVVEAMTRKHGRHLGLVRGARSSRLAAALQPGNSLSLVWRARLDEHLGAFVIEPMTMRAGRLLASGMALAGINYLGALLRLLPERYPHEGLFEALTVVADHLDEVILAPALMARFEARVLQESGFALDLETCVVTGDREGLIYVSPKSGRAVSAVAGEPYRDRLLPLPAFLRPNSEPQNPSEGDVVAAFRLTGFFLARDLFGARGLAMPDARGAFLRAASVLATR